MQLTLPIEKFPMKFVRTLNNVVLMLSMLTMAIVIGGCGKPKRQVTVFILDSGVDPSYVHKDMFICPSEVRGDSERLPLKYRGGLKYILPEKIFNTIYSPDQGTLVANRISSQCRHRCDIVSYKICADVPDETSVHITSTIDMIIKEMPKLTKKFSITEMIYRGSSRLVTRQTEPTLTKEHIAEVMAEVITIKTGPLRIINDKVVQALHAVLEFVKKNPDVAVIVNIRDLGDSYDSDIAELIKRIVELGIIVVAPVGEDNSDILSYPAACEGVVAVAGTDGFVKSRTSNYGTYVDISADYKVDYTKKMDDTYVMGEFAGNQYAAALVSGLIVDLLIEEPDLMPLEGLSILKKRAHHLKNDPYYARGLLGSNVLPNQ